jgi:hypothetical protein
MSVEPAKEPSKEPDWLGGLRNAEDTSNDTPNAESTSQGGENSDPEQEEFIPDWLARIREREAAEKAEEKAKEDEYWAEKQSHEGMPDWLRTLNEDAAGISNTPHEENQPQEPAPVEKPNPPAEKPKTIPESNDKWLESLKSWQPDKEEDSLNPILDLPQNDSSEINPILEEGLTSQESLESERDFEFDLEKIFSPVEDEPANEPQKTIEEPDSAENQATVQEPILPDGFQSFDSMLDEIFQPENSKIEEPVTDNQDNLPVNLPWEEPMKVSPDIQLQAEGEFQDESKLYEEAKNEFTLANEEPEPNSEISEGTPEEIPEISLETGSTIPDEVILAPIEEATPEIVNQPNELVGSFKAEDISLEGFDTEELPVWLTDNEPTENKKSTTKPRVVTPQIDDGSLKPEKGNLPVWLESRRPVESLDMVSPSANPSEPAEIDSPINPAQSLLSQETAIPLSGKPSDLGSGLKVSNRQKTNAVILAAIAAATESEEVAEAKVDFKRNQLWRFVLALVFIAMAILGGTLLNNFTQPIDYFPEQVVHAYDSVNSISVDKPVLISGDFEAAFAGEMRLASQSLIEHIMRRNLAIALMSVNPVDSALLTDQIAGGSAIVPSYQSASKVVDLGYLPGGAIAIQNLGTSFTSSVPLTASLIPINTHEITKNIQNLNDFGAIIIIIDKPETARVWIEQIQPILGNTPLLMITSAQASPLIQPYYQSGQLDGLISGMSGGMIYERLLGTTGDAGRKASSLQLILILMAGIVLIGGFISLVKPKASGGKSQ